MKVKGAFFSLSFGCCAMCCMCMRSHLIIQILSRINIYRSNVAILFFYIILLSLSLCEARVKKDNAIQRDTTRLAPTHLNDDSSNFFARFQKADPFRKMLWVLDYANLVLYVVGYDEGEP